MAKNFSGLDFHEKSSVITSWVQTIAVISGISGIIFGLFQINLAIDAFQNKKLTKTFDELEMFEKKTEASYKALIDYYTELYPTKFPDNPEKHINHIRNKYSAEKLDKDLKLILKEIDRLLRLSSSGIIEEKVVKNDITWRISLLIAHINNDRFPKEWDLVPAAKGSLEIRFYETAPFIKRLFYSQTEEIGDVID